VLAPLIEDIEIPFVIVIIREISRLEEKAFEVCENWSGGVIVFRISSQDDCTCGASACLLKIVSTLR
jgi:hypothetical protein